MKLSTTFRILQVLAVVLALAALFVAPDSRLPQWPFGVLAVLLIVAAILLGIKAETLREAEAPIPETPTMEEVEQ